MTETLALQAELDGLIILMQGKTLIRPDATVWLHANSSASITLSWIKKDEEQYAHAPYDPKNYGRLFFTIEGDDYSAGFLSARAAIAAMPEKAERERDEFLKLLASTIEYGHKVGIEDGFVNPLRVMAQKLSENAIAGPGSDEEVF